MNIAIIGGDTRMLAAGEKLSEHGYKCALFGFDSLPTRYTALTLIQDAKTAVECADAVVLPFPCVKDGVLNAPLMKEKVYLNDILSYGTEKTLFIGGRIPNKGSNFADYSDREDFLLRNAVPTAEGAVAIAINETKTTLRGSNALVLGYGRIGSYLANALKSLGAHVTVAARRTESRALAEISGINAVGFDNIEASLKNADILFNTVPFRLLGQKELSALKKGTAIIELASFPGGADEETARAYNINLIKALGLPGKVAPISAGNAVCEAVISILTERGLVK